MKTFAVFTAALFTVNEKKTIFQNFRDFFKVSWENTLVGSIWKSPSNGHYMRWLKFCKVYFYRNVDNPQFQRNQFF